jgi:uncharacterized protein (DUF1697 family)
MTTHIALLRAINLPGHNKIAMAPLRALLADLGMRNVQSLLQSGNLVFQSNTRSATKLESQLKTEVAKRFKVATDFFICSVADWKRVIAVNPFPKEARDDPGHLLVIFLKAAPKPAHLAALERAIKGRERVRLHGRHAYIVYPDGVGRSRLTAAVIEKHLETTGTGRNWNTVLKLGAMAEAT